MTEVFVSAEASERAHSFPINWVACLEIEDHQVGERLIPARSAFLQVPERRKPTGVTVDANRNAGSLQRNLDEGEVVRVVVYVQYCFQKKACPAANWRPNRTDCAAARSALRGRFSPLSLAGFVKGTIGFSPHSNAGP